MMPLAVISYDIVDDNRRNKVAKVLLDYGSRVQFSVFEVTLTEKIPEIKERLSPLINQKEDNVRYYMICKGCEHKKSVFGLEKAHSKDFDYLVI